MNPRVSVVIPALNEAASIGAVLAELPRPPVVDVVVVDGGSSDQTRSIAEGCGARVFVERRRGYGRAGMTGVEHAPPAS